MAKKVTISIHILAFDCCFSLKMCNPFIQGSVKYTRICVNMLVCMYVPGASVSVQ